MKLVSIADNPVPEGAVAGAVKTRNGIALRFARWDGLAGAKGTVLLAQGRTEFIEKYFEVVRELQSRGFAVVTFDWRGQGLSDRLLPDRRKGHVENFAQYDLDLKTVIEQAVPQNFPRRLIGMAHSMGGAVMLRAAAGSDISFERIVLTSPMVGLPGLASSVPVRGLIGAMQWFGFGNAYIPGGSGEIDRPFAGNKHTQDPERYARTTAVLAAEPALGIGSPTIGWTHAALSAMHEFTDAACAGRIRDRTLIVAAGEDEIASTPASREFAGRSAAITHIVIAGAKHELLIEQDRYRAPFWSAFDEFVR